MAAILFPVFAKAREKARQSSCQSNLKQITLGVLQYIQDYDEMTPSQHNRADIVLVDPYLKNRQVWVCPSSATATYNVGNHHITGATTTFSRGNGYVSNNDFFGGGWDGDTSANWKRSRALADFKEVAVLPVYADNDGNQGAVWPARYTNHVTPWPKSANGSLRVGLDHNETANMSFADGHVKAMNKTPTISEWTNNYL